MNKESGYCVTQETIYKWIWTAKHSNHYNHAKYKRLCKHQRHTGRRQKRNNTYNKRSAITGCVGVNHQPQVVDNRYRISDIEVDLMMGRNHKLALLVMTDRATLVTIIEKLNSKNANEVYQRMNERLTNFDSPWIKTLKFYNVKEFAYHYKIAK
ncbi:IS30 family transposase [Maribacter sp. ACAM166]|uniref:IS30 family transposase n=1 Tax=Maribacter sp. ACAM166 TaxID=2508996 RepID=UPI002938EBC4|nr:IS30 family transposase [Maribacter sp. ACAM166]